MRQIKPLNTDAFQTWLSNYIGLLAPDTVIGDWLNAHPGSRYYSLPKGQESILTKVPLGEICLLTEGYEGDHVAACTETSARILTGG